MKRVIFLLLFPLIAEVVVSCCNCLETKSFRYTNKSLSVSNLDDSGAQAELSRSNIVVRKAYGIRASLLREQLACLPRRPSLFITAAYAFSCGCPPATTYLAQDSITAIRIFTAADFDTDHPAGSNITAYFKVFYEHTYYTVDHFVKTSPVTLYWQPDLSLSRDFLLMTPPPAGGDHRFKVQFVLSDGRILEQETPTVKLV